MIHRKRFFLAFSSFLLAFLTSQLYSLLRPAMADHAVDVERPIVTITVNPISCSNGGRCYTTSATITATCTSADCAGHPTLTGTGSTPTTEDSAHTATAAVSTAQTYNLTATALDTTGNAGSSSYSFTINPLLSPSCSVPSSAPTGRATLWTASATGGNAPITYSWAFTGYSPYSASLPASIIGNLTSTTRTYYNAGTDTATLTATSGDGQTATGSCTLTIYPVVSAWIQAVGDVHSNIGINASGGP